MRQLNGCQFYRQRIIGDYIADFFCPKAKLVVELDGGQHHSGPNILADRERDDYINGLGLMVLRFDDTDVLRNTEGVVETILENMRALNQANCQQNDATA